MTAFKPLNSTCQKNDQLKIIKEWFVSDKGKRLVAQEVELLNSGLSRCLGEHVVYYGLFPELKEEFQNCSIFFSLGEAGTTTDIYCVEDTWSILTESVEVVILQHALDFAQSPHAILREAARAVRPGGHLLLTGFNPWSVWSGYRLINRNVFKKTHYIAWGRLVDWLRLLGFSIEYQWRCGFYPPLNRVCGGRLFDKLETVGQKWCWGGASYVISARKMLMQATPMFQQKRFLLSSLPRIPAINRSDVKKLDDQ